MIRKRLLHRSVALMTAGVSLLASAATDEKRIWVQIASPRAGQAVIGEVVIAAEVVARGTIRDVSFFVDGRPVGMVSTAPFRLRIDLGEANRSHEIEVVATDVDGFEARHRVSTRPLDLGAEYEVDLRQVYVTVTRSDEALLDLDRASFTVLDDGVPQQLVTFAAGDVPFTAALLIDTSESMGGSKLEAARAGAEGFINGMRELDQAALITFADTIRNVTPFTTDRGLLNAELVGNRGRGGTAVHDALFTGFSLLELRQGRRVVVLLSDGIDSHSGLSGDDLLEHARTSQVMVYWVRLVEDADRAGDSGRLASSWRTPEAYDRNLAALEELVELTGGRVALVHSPEEIRPVFVGILKELREQYALGYYPSDRREDGSWHRVRVKVDRPDAAVRAPRGYLDQ